MLSRKLCASSVVIATPQEESLKTINSILVGSNANMFTGRNTGTYIVSSNSCLAWDGNTVIAGYNGYNVLYSIDRGLTWLKSGTWSNITGSAYGRVVAYAFGTFYAGLAGASALNRNSTALSATNCFQQKLLPLNAGTVINFKNKLIIPVFSGSSTLKYSLDGNTFITGSLPSTAGVVTYAQNADMLVVFSANGTTMYSYDGIQFKLGNSIPFTPTGVSYGNGVWLAVGLGNNYARSIDGITWTSGVLPNTTLAGYKSLGYGGIFLLVATGFSTALTTYDGETWAEISLPSASAWYGVSYNGSDTFVVISTGQTNCLSISLANKQ